MTSITLTEEQVQAVVEPYLLGFKKQMQQDAARDARLLAALKRQADDRVFRARQKTSNWKLQYAETRKNLLAARAEIIALKRRLRNGDWEDA